MNSFTIDLLLSGFTYVVLTYLTFILMRKKKRRNNDGDDDGGFTLSPPTIDLPPGISWPSNGPEISHEELEEAH
ncbi:MAG: hypothetical protein HEP71_19180 [Roseivirga sp.]|nr:hypothetical protein [Roseivirga sp.]